MSGLCAQCQEEVWKWLDYRPHYPIQIGTVSGDDTVRGTVERRKMRSDDTRRLIRTQIDFITTSCLEGHTRPTDTLPTQETS